MDEIGQCVGYFSAGLDRAGSSKELVPIVWFHGDNPSGMVDLEIGLIRANRVFQKTGVPFIYFSRVSAWGEGGGSWTDRHSRRSKRVINAALDAIKERHSITAYILVGQSGGSHDVAMVLHRRNDIKCAVLGAAPVSIRYLHQIGSPKVGGHDSDDPIEFVSKIPPSPFRRIILVHDPADQTIDSRNATDYLSELTKFHHNGEFVETTGRSNLGHDVSQTSMRIAVRCARQNTS